MAKYLKQAGIVSDRHPVTEFIHKFPNKLSGGQAQRVMIALVLSKANKQNPREVAEKIKEVLLKKIDDSFKEKDNIIPIIKRIETSIKLILSISFHHNCILKKLFMINFFY